MGTTAPVERLREDMAFELARWVLGDRAPKASPDQLTLSL
ncbi:DUF6771 family protein [Novosphingobium sp. G106]|nr:DUF6771 family protein [Novosphingobium sp. G106]